MLADTLASIRAFSDPEDTIVLPAHRSSVGRFAGLAAAARASLVAHEALGLGGPLYFALAQGLQLSLAQTDLRAVVKLDTDAVVCNPGVRELATDYFAANPHIAIAGQLIRPAPPAENGYTAPGGAVVAEASVSRLISRPFKSLTFNGERAVKPVHRIRRWWAVRRLLKAALRRGYIPGEHCQGGAYLLNPSFVRELHARRLLPSRALGMPYIPEDSIFALLARALGWGIGDLGGETGPISSGYKSMLIAPEDALTQGKMIVHSVRRWQDMDEQAVRAVFRRARREASMTEVSA